MSGCAVKGGNVGASDVGLSAEEHVHLGAIYEGKGLDDLALREYEAAAELDLAFGDFAAANIHFKQKNYDDAISGFLEAIDKDPENPVFYNNLAWVYIVTGEYEDARAAADEALLKAEDQRYMYLDTAGVAYFKLEDFTRAEEYLSDAAATVPADNREGRMEIYSHLLDLYARTGEARKAAQVRLKLEEMTKKGE